MSSTTRAAVSRARVAVVLCGWGVALLLLAAIEVLGSIAPSEVPEASEIGPQAWAVGVVAVSVQAAVLVWARERPLLAVVAVCAVVPAAAAGGLGVAIGVTSVAVLIAAYVAVVDVPWPRPASALVTAAVLVGAGELVRGGSIGSAALQGLGTVGLAAVAGAVVTSRRETSRARAGRDLAIAGEQAALTQAAVARERVAMARELHDIAAHHLSGIAVMTAALDRQIDTDPDGAKTAVRQVRQQSTAMLRDLRSLVALLREDDQAGGGGGEVEPETLGGVPALVDAARLAGRDVRLSVLGTDDTQLAALGTGPLAQLAAYRTVQESLANAARHAPGASCEVVIDVRDPAEVVLVVHNAASPGGTPTAPSGRGGGFGIIGMRERADLTDARLTAGPTPDGGWSVRLAMPSDTREDPP
jgi:signal transduction histidine kinase